MEQIIKSYGSNEDINMPLHRDNNLKFHAEINRRMNNIMPSFKVWRSKVLKYFDYRYKDIFGKTSYRASATERDAIKDLILFVAKRRYKYTYQETARLHDRVNHSTIFAAEKRFYDRFTIKDYLYIEVYNQYKKIFNDDLNDILWDNPKKRTVKK